MEDPCLLYKDESLRWLRTAKEIGGSFIKAFATAVMAADLDNLRILEPALRAMREKYPYYDQVDSNHIKW